MKHFPLRQQWIKLGCFLTGYNPNILAGCSEISTKRVLRYTSAITIICFLWAFIGYCFSSRYLKLDWYYSIVSALFAITIVVQIERQVILSPKGNNLPLVFRMVIALLMAIIGSVIIDQIMFKDDIEQQKIIMMDDKIKVVLPAKSEELKRQIRSIDSAVMQKENERSHLIDDINKHPTITIFSKKTTQLNPVGNKADSLKKETVVRASQQIQNPKMNLLKPLDDQIASLRDEKYKKDSLLLMLRPSVEAELKEKVGFLDELDLMFQILGNSNIALITWSIWFLLLLGLELFIVVSKLNEPETDYDKMLEQQTLLHYKRIELLGKH
ncbi:DUF4407 domain-containing protein [Chryseotalea sanaruensis]|uniref:DUF4407 domain-containing protein n=1 Tax=Chryseotalea sanaruensis TaxID=2482724 RepID=A0A401U5A2_9BACT|nr:DUF4407 domain-containing protein [Chryseotalea sanaruensis]GCC50113.1 DUF4407 domain-containing protein [Chryseotalea sanaruensis]